MMAMITVSFPVFSKLFSEAIKENIKAFPLWFSGLRTWVVSMGMRVQSLASLSGWRILCCHELQCRSQIRLGSGVAVAVGEAGAIAPIWPLAWKFPYAMGATQKKKKKKKKERERERTFREQSEYSSNIHFQREDKERSRESSPHSTFLQERNSNYSIKNMQLCLNSFPISLLEKEPQSARKRMILNQ